MAASLALLPALMLFGIYAVTSVRENPLLSAVPRDLDVLELWSGAATVVPAARQFGLTAREFDKNRGGMEVEEDLSSHGGFHHALNLVLRLKPGGLLWMAPVCSSFVFADSSHTKRTNAAPEAMGLTSL